MQNIKYNFEIEHKHSPRNLKKIAYIELDTHAEIAHHFLVLSKMFSAMEMDFYLSEKIIRLLNTTDERVISSTAENLISLIQQKKYDAVIIGTSHRYFSTFSKICSLFPTALIVHNLHFSQLNRWKLFKNIWKKDWQYRLKLLLKEGLFSSSTINEKAKNILVLDKTLDFQKLLFKDKTKAISIFYNSENHHETEKIKVVIPGTVSQERRDYKKVFSLLKEFKTSMEVVFLGKASGQELSQLQQLEKVLPKQLSINYFKEKVSQEIFENEMQSASVLWCPLQPNIPFFSQNEIYGKTKISGNIADAIKFGKPAIFPVYYPQNYPFIFKEKENIEQQIIDLKNFAFDFQKDFSKVQIAAKLEKVLLEI